MKFNHIRMKGFKIHEEEREIIFDDYTKIKADNAKGKTTIGDAIAWCFLGTDINGTEKINNRLLNNKSKDMYVSLEFEHEGKIHTLSRDTKNNRTTVTLDNNMADQIDLMNFVRDKELFLAIFNPMYFTNLTPKQEKDLLRKYLGEVSFEDVMKKLGQEGKTLLADGFKDPRLYIQLKRDRLKAIEVRDNYLRGFIAAKAEHVSIPPVAAFSEEQEFEYLNLQAELEELNEKPMQLHDISKQLQAKEQLQVQIAALRDSYYKLKNHNAVFEEEKTLAEKKTRKASLLQQHKSLTAQLKGTASNTIVCPTCQTEIEVNQGYIQRLSTEISEVLAEGKKITAEIENLEKQLANKQAAHFSNLDTELEALEIQRDALLQEMNSIDVATFELENSNYLKNLNTQKGVIQNRINELVLEKQRVDTENSNREKMLQQVRLNESQIEDAQKELSSLEAERNVIGIRIESANKFNSIRLKMQAEHLEKYLDKVSIQFEKIVKSTGEVKEDFKIQYEEKDFNQLSASERIKVGLEISNLLLNFSDQTFPIFIDNAEGITIIPDMNTQVIATYVTEGQELTVA